MSTISTTASDVAATDIWPPVRAGAADDGSGEGYDEPVGSDRRLRRPELRDGEDRPDRRQEPGERVGEDDRSVSRNARQLGRVRVSADREQIAPRHGAGEEESERRADHDRRREQIGYGEEARRAEGDEKRRQIVERDRLR